MKNVLVQWLSKLFNFTQGNTKQNNSALFNSIGGEESVHQLVNAFYDIMDTTPSVSALRAIHSEDLTQARHRFYLFMVGWLGGPPLFEQQFGHPRLRQRHLPFKVDQSMVSQWLYCMNKALENTVENPKHRELIYQRLSQLAYHMINQHPQAAKTTNPEV